MKSDLDRLMIERELDALVILKASHADVMAMNYMTGNASLGAAYLIKKSGEPAALICGAFERDEAAKSGLQVSILQDYDLTNLRKEHKDDAFGLQVALWNNIFAAFDINHGRVGFYGLADPGVTFQVLNRLVAARPDIEVVGETGIDIFTAAMRTKDPAEIESLIDVGKRASAIVNDTLDFITGHVVKNGAVVKANGAPLTIGEVKRFVRAQLLKHDLEAPEDMIFAQGRDAGVPHSQGEDADALQTGKSIIFDFFPCDRHTGYYHDMTRTWCLGYAPDDVQEAYAQVMEAFDAVMATYRVGAKCIDYQNLVCDIFEKYGHNTARNDDDSLEGYLHSLGHGIGLNIHEAPRFSHFAPNDTLEVGNAFTLEPGLYYPNSKGWGVRIEDSLYIDADGKVKSLTDMPKDLIITW
ncbi:MAG: aminopeptidase P family protein [Anaerolineae bacterium]|nr:aminopeptidase P family protein [Anaerolineae bacterium]